MGSKSPVNVLFICSANRFRSVIAAARFQNLLNSHQVEENWVISSAGTWATKGLPPIAQAIHFAQTRGLEIENIRSREVSDLILENADLIIVMSEGQKEALRSEFSNIEKRLFLLSEICEGQVYDIPDPIEKVDETPEDLGTEICKLISSGFDNIYKTARYFYGKRNDTP
jgi:protein-tyrosine-phosphatase